MYELVKIQNELKAPKNQYNAFGKYKYRSCEDILEALKPWLLLHECTLVITDQVKEVAGIAFIESTVIISKGDLSVSVTAQAGIDVNRKGMDVAQCFGASSSYSRKYALNGLFLIDDSALDPDARNDHAPKQILTVAPVVKVEPTEEQFAYIVRYLNGTDAQRKQAKEALVKYKLTQEQADTIEGL